MSATIAIVTGAASGIGKACAQRLLADGASVVAFDLDARALEGALGGESDRLALCAGDVSQPDDCARAVTLAGERFGTPDALIHCAAAHSPQFWTELEADEFNRVLAVNVTGSFLIAKAAAKAMREAGRGAIVLTSSSNAILGGTGGQSGAGGPAYVASKAAIVGLTRSLARSMGPDGVRVNAVMPGVTDTPMIAGYSAENRAAAFARSPLGRIGEPEDIADVMCFLVSDKARFMAGETVIVNGGSHFG